MSVSSITLPPECVKELELLVGYLSNENLTELAATEIAFQVGGFRNSKPEILRTRARQLACAGSEISPSFRRMLAGRSQGATLFRLLPLEVITQNRVAFAALLGEHAFTVALLLDARTEIRAKGEEWLTLPLLPPCTTEEALAQLCDVFAPLTGVLGASATADMPVTQDAWRKQKEQLELRIHELLEQNRRLKGVDDRLSGAKRQLAASEEQTASAKRRADEAERALRQKNVALDDLSAELKREAAQREDRLTAAIDLALAKEFHGWLASARTIEAATQNGASTGDLLSRAEAALTHQQEMDRHSGNRAKLEQRLEALEALHGRVTSTLRNAIRQSSNLKEVERELAAETGRLRQTLDIEEEDPIESALIDRIHAAHDNALPELRTLPDKLAATGLLPSDALARVRNAFQKRLSAIEAIGVPPDPETEEKKNTISVLGRALAGQMPAILMVDGHNVLFGLPTRYNPPRGGSASETGKRNRLISDIARLMAPNPASRAWVVFDGATRSDTQAAPNVRVTYSGGTGEHRADGVLLDNIRFFKRTSPEMIVLLVSNDADLCKTAVRLGAQTIPVLELGAFF